MYALFIGFGVLPQGGKATGKEDKEAGAVVVASASAPPAIAADFQWSDHRQLSWDDFRGPVSAVTDASAAATNCGLGFRTQTDTSGNLSVVVYNKFYASKSWVKPDAHIASILVHEQGHFDLCELYTRKLRQQMALVDMGSDDLEKQLIETYNAVNAEHEAAQQRYEAETIHGTNEVSQAHWTNYLTTQLDAM